MGGQQSALKPRLGMGNRGSAGVAVAFTLAFVVIISAIAVAGGSPASSSETSAEPIQRTNSVETSVQESLSNANQKAIRLTDWSGSTSASGYASSGPPIRRFIPDSIWAGMNAQSRQALQTETGAMIASMKSQYANTGESINIEPTGYKVGTRVTYFGWFNETGDSVKFAEDVTDTRDLVIQINRDSLKNKQSGSLKIVFQGASGTTYRMKLWQSDDKILFSSNQGFSHSVTGKEATIDFTEGTINGNNVPIEPSDYVTTPYDLWFHDADQGLGMIEFMSAGTPGIEVSSQTGNVDDDKHPQPWVRVHRGVVLDANFKVSYMADGTTYTDTTKFEADRSSTRACNVPSIAGPLPCNGPGNVFTDPNKKPVISISDHPPIEEGSHATWTPSISEPDADDSIKSVEWNLVSHPTSPWNSQWKEWKVRTQSKGKIQLDAKGSYEISVTAMDDDGLTTTKTVSVYVTDESNGGGANGGDWEPNTNDDCYYPDDSVYTCNADSVISGGGDSVTIVDTDGDGKVTVDGTTYENIGVDGKKQVSQEKYKNHYQVDAGPNSDDDSGGSLYHNGNPENGDGVTIEDEGGMLGVEQDSTNTEEENTEGPSGGSGSSGIDDILDPTDSSGPNPGDGFSFF